MASAFRWYQHKLATRPLLTSSISSAVLFATGDVLAQQAVEGKTMKKHDWARTSRMALYGGALFGPAATLWYRVLQKRIVFAGRPNLEILGRVGADQLVFAPCNMFVFLNTMALLEGSDPKEKLNSAYWPALRANWYVWPAVQFVNFKYVPLDLRVLVVNIISLGWNCYLSYINSSGDASTYEDEGLLG